MSIGRDALIRIFGDDRQSLSLEADTDQELSSILHQFCYFTVYKAPLSIEPTHWLQTLQRLTSYLQIYNDELKMGRRSSVVQSQPIDATKRQAFVVVILAGLYERSSRRRRFDVYGLVLQLESICTSVVQISVLNV